MLLTLVPFSAMAAAKMRVTGNYVNLRDLKTNQPIGMYNSGTIVTLISTGNGYMYHVRVDADGREGRMYREYLQPYNASSNQNNNTNTNTNANTNTNTNTNTNANNNNGGKVDAKKTDATPNAAVARNNDTVRGTITKPTNVRATANNNSKIVGSLQTRTTVNVLGRQGNNVYITTGKFSGYVSASSVMLNNTVSRTAVVKKVNNGNYKVYTGSTGTGKAIASVNASSKITVLHPGSAWSYVKVGNVYGYIASNMYTMNKSN